MLLKEGLCTDSHTRWGGALCKHSTTTHKYRHSPKNMLLSIAPQARGFAVFPLWCPASVCVSMDSSLGMSHTLLRGVCVCVRMCVQSNSSVSGQSACCTLHAAAVCGPPYLPLSPSLLVLVLPCLFRPLPSSLALPFPPPPPLIFLLLLLSGPSTS